MEEIHNVIPMHISKPNFVCKVHEDNQSCIKMATGIKFSPRTKHIALKYHHFRSHVKSGRVEIQYRPTEEQLADLLTKPLSNEAFFTLRYMLWWWIYKPKAWLRQGFLPKGHFTWHKFGYFSKVLFSFWVGYFSSNKLAKCQAHVVILPQFFIFILDGPFCHHNSASKTDASSRGSVRIQVLIGARIWAQGWLSHPRTWKHLRPYDTRVETWSSELRRHLRVDSAVESRRTDAIIDRYRWNPLAFVDRRRLAKRTNSSLFWLPITFCNIDRVLYPCITSKCLTQVFLTSSISTNIRLSSLVAVFTVLPNNL